MMGVRRKAREISLKILYSLEFSEEFKAERTSDGFVKNIIDYLTWEKKILLICEDLVNNLEETAKEKSKEYLSFLLEQIIVNLEQIDNVINDKLRNCCIDDLSIIDKNILRIAVAELLFCKTPGAVIIDEMVEISKKYSKDRASLFIHGVLDKIIKGQEVEEVKM